MNTKEYLKKMKKINEEYDKGTNGLIFNKLGANDYKEIIEQRRVRALEIIAEELIVHNETAKC